VFKSLVRSMLLTVLLSALPFLAAAGSLDDYYISQFDAHYGRQLQPAGVVSVQAAGPHERCLTPLYHALKRDWKQLAPETRKVLAKYLAKPTLAGEAIARSGDSHFFVHYATSGPDAPPLTDANGNGIPDWVETVAAVFEAVYSREVSEMGYQQAPTTGGQPYDVYLQDLGATQQFGITESDTPITPGSTSFTSFITIDNDFADPVYSPFTAEKGLKITAAHEYHHAIQYGYNFFFDIWYAEATSTWIEDEVFDSVNQLYNYLPAYFQNAALRLDAPVDVNTGGGYGRWVLNRYVAEIKGRDFIRQVWELLMTKPAPANNSDIAMVPVLDEALGGNLANLVLGLGARFVARNWASHQQDISQIHPLAAVAGSTTVVSSYPTASNSFSFTRLDSALAPTGTMVINLVSKPSSVAAMAFLQVPGPGGTTSNTEFFYNPISGTITVPAVSAGSSVILMLCNNTTGGSPPPPEPVQTIPNVTDAPIIIKNVTQVAGPTVVTPVSSGGGGGCFIATAAYGSYLHPKVMLLREFRDNCLLTSAPGRAFVALYYRVSPPLADFIARHDSLRSASRILLTPVVLAVEYKGLATVVLLIGVFAMAGGYLRSRSFM
jgi:hypothetical protein